MKKLKRIIPIIIVAVIVVLGVTMSMKLLTRHSPNQNNIAQNIVIASPEDLAKIKREEGKVNIYFFHGDGCPHCAEEFNYFQEIAPGYGDKYNLYTFETWYNDENNELLKVFAEKMGDQIRGIPYTVIGEESFIGFPSDAPRKFAEAIESQSHNSFDIYLDEIK